MIDGAYIGEEFVPFGGKILVWVYCGKATRSTVAIAEVRTDPSVAFTCLL